MSYSSSDIRIERSIYFFYWLFKFARSVVVKSRSAFYFIVLQIVIIIFTIHILRFNNYIYNTYATK